ncbi:unnamed protein product, partial [Meganyctiphanes norvegica]
MANILQHRMLSLVLTQRKLFSNFHNSSRLLGTKLKNSSQSQGLLHTAASTSLNKFLIPTTAGLSLHCKSWKKINNELNAVKRLLERSGVSHQEQVNILKRGISSTATSRNQAGGGQSSGGNNGNKNNDEDERK